MIKINHQVEVEIDVNPCVIQINNHKANTLTLSQYHELYEKALINQDLVKAVDCDIETIAKDVQRQGICFPYQRECFEYLQQLRQKAISVIEENK
ncbi:hypothetical protein C1N32_20780 [Vibrio diazotrophicus]|uniref:Uncharacterized protein n=1 Tax=Vibrio diazotrophicus TaxID=685 RepID=A0A2J8HSN5_VIBDI|nr:hypothetical protein [Vibrio diazotrophicus]PNI01201.1 hypothetical protein C1N32_20780 [Vibrio diazotrophicus]